MRKILLGLGYVVVGVSVVAGEYGAITLFFNIETCADNNCHWTFATWHLLLWGPLFLFIYLPLSPLVSLFYAWPGYIVGGILAWIARR